MTSRRAFLKSTSLAAFSFLQFEKGASAKPDKKKIGLQLYTVRDHVQTDLEGTLVKLAGIGYKQLEAAGYNDGKFYGLEPVVLKKMVDNLGMKIIGSHASFSDAGNRQAIDAHAALGTEYVVLPWLGFENPSHGAFMLAAERMNKTGQLCRDAGLSFGYHNHAHEFAVTDRGLGFDLLLQHTDPSLVLFELDFFWMKKAGYEPLDYFRKYAGRFGLWHVKDMASTPEKEDTEVGTGIIQFDALFAEKKTAGMKHFFIENDNPHGDSLESAALSYHNLLKVLP